MVDIYSRPFKTVSFKYPVQLNVPAFSVTNTYQSYGRNNKKGGIKNGSSCNETIT